MKKTALTMITALTVALSANAMSYEQARNEALFLTDKMAYELNLTDAQYDAAYEINLDYLMGVTSRDDVYGAYWAQRNLDIGYILLEWQWNAFLAATYFYRPLYWDGGFWHFAIYARYPRRDYFFFGRPAIYHTYRGGHSWRSNGGRSYYEGHKSAFHASASKNEGMREQWNRGDYQRSSNTGINSSTHTTVNGGFGGSRNNVGSRRSSNRSVRSTGRYSGTSSSARPSNSQRTGTVRQSGTATSAGEATSSGTRSAYSGGGTSSKTATASPSSVSAVKSATTGAGRGASSVSGGKASGGASVGKSGSSPVSGGTRGGGGK